MSLTIFVICYIFLAAITALRLRAEGVRLNGKDDGILAACIILWPVTWTIALISVFGRCVIWLYRKL